MQDLDINELCTEFTSKAKCDGTKVVLEPSGVHHIIEKLSAKAAAAGAQK
jgi:AP-1-like transcription factor